MGMGYAPTWLRQVSPPLLHKTTLTTVYRKIQNGLTYWYLLIQGILDVKTVLWLLLLMLFRLVAVNLRERDVCKRISSGANYAELSQFLLPFQNLTPTYDFR